MVSKRITIKISIIAVFFLITAQILSAQRYKNGLIDKSVAVIGEEMISLSDLEQEVQMMKVQGHYLSGKNLRCTVLENMMESKLFLMQARIDSLAVNNDMVQGELSQRMDQLRTQLGGDDEVEAYFGKPMYRLKQEWMRQIEDMTLTQQEQGAIADKVPGITPFDVAQYVDTVSVDDLPMIPIKYQLSQICIYPDREAANMAVKEKLLGIRERIINGEKFSTLARIYSEDPGSALKGGELGMASKSIFWPAFSDAAMSLKPGVISQIVQTPDGFHLIEIIDKKGDMFNARHILIRPRYTEADRKKAFGELDSLKTQIQNEAVTFEMAAQFYSQDDKTKTNGGQMADPMTGSSYFEIDQLKPDDYNAIKNLKEGEISEPIQSLDNEGRSGNTVYKIIKVDKIIPAHRASFDHDYSSLLETVKHLKQMQAIDNFIESKIKSTYIIIDPFFQKCNFRRKGWAEKFDK